MTIMSSDNKDDKKNKIAELRKFQEPIFEALNIPDALYIPKMQYKPSGKDEDFIGLFASELKLGKDIYTEKVSYDLVSEDPHRNLYKWPYNPHWSSEYEQATSKNSNAPRYLIPVAELVLVSKSEIVSKAAKASHVEDMPYIGPSFLDKPIGSLTVRELAAILNELVDPKPF